MACLDWWIIHHTILLYCITFVFSDQTCGTAYACVSQFLNDSDTTRAYGYKSAFGSSTSFSGGALDCLGSFSCHSMEYIKSNTGDHCRARDSCSNTTIEAALQIECVGSNSCSFSSITTSDDAHINCHGYLSCRGTYIHGIEYIKATGSLSMYKTIIDTIDIIGNTIDIDLIGNLAGFGGKLICRESHTCNINCDGFDSCYMFYIECIGQCTVTTSSTNTIAPATNLTQFNHQNINIIPTTLSNDELCTIDALNFDDNQENEGGLDIIVHDQGPICCRGAKSCKDITIIINNDLICSGYSSCRTSSIMSNNRSIYCEAQSACYGSSISYAHHVYCTGAWSCRNASITNVTHVVCSGYVGCQYATFKSDGSNLNAYFVAPSSGKYAVLYCNESDSCNIYCRASTACSQMQLYCTENCNVECDGTDYDCPIPRSTNEDDKLTTMDPTEATLDYASFTTLNTTKMDILTTNEVIHDIVNTIYKISFDIKDCDEGDTYCSVEYINNIIFLAFLDYNATILHSDIIDNTVFIELSVKTDPNQVLSADHIKKDVENELDVEYVDVDIGVDVDGDSKDKPMAPEPASDEWIVIAAIVAGFIGYLVLFTVIYIAIRLFNIKFTKEIHDLSKPKLEQVVSSSDVPLNVVTNMNQVDIAMMDVRTRGWSEGIQRQENKMNIVYNMNAINDPVVFDHDETAGQEEVQTITSNIVYNMNAQNDAIVSGDDTMTPGTQFM